MSRGELKEPLVVVEKIKPTVNLGAGDWLQLEYVLYKDKQGIQRKWERCIRKKESKSNIDAIDVHAILLTPLPEILLVVQYRPAIERYCIEFPSGLIDPDENDPINSAQRELKEETGYLIEKEKFELLKVPIAYEPGLCNSCCYVAKVIIDIENDMTIASPVQELEPDEWSLQTVSLPLKGLLNKLLELEKANNGLLIIDSRVHAFAAGLSYSEIQW